MILAVLIATRAERNSDFPVLTFECAGKDDEVRTFAELQERGNRIAADLIARGLQRGDRFALMMRNHPEFVETMIAASISATVFVPIDPRTKGEKLAYTLRNAGCKGILLADYNLAQLEEIRGSVPDLSFSLAMETGHALSRLPVLPTLLSTLEEWYDRLFAGEAEKIAEAWRPLSMLLGQEVVVFRGERKTEGVVKDLSPVDGVLLRSDAGEEWVPAEHVTYIRTADDA